MAPPPTEFSTLSLHDALPISVGAGVERLQRQRVVEVDIGDHRDRRLAHDRPQRVDVLIAGNRHPDRSEEHTSELQSQSNLVCRLLLEKKKKKIADTALTTKKS